MKWLAILGALILAPYIAWKIAYPTYTHRFRLTVEFETSQGLKSGSSVIEISQTDGPTGFVTGGPSGPRAKGEAVFVDLGQGRNVVALLGHGPTAAEYSRIALLSALAFGSDGRYTWKTLQSLTGQRELAPDLIPTLVTIPDVKDAKSAIVMTPEQVPQVLGSDIKFTRAWIELTRDPITRNLEKGLPVLANPNNWPSRWYGDSRSFVPNLHMFVRN